MSWGGDEECGVGVSGETDADRPRQSPLQPEEPSQFPVGPHPQYCGHCHQVHHIRSGQCNVMLGTWKSDHT